jgi:hypothetical protein
MEQITAWRRGLPAIDPLHPELSSGAMMARRAGNALQLAGVLYAEGRHEESSRVFIAAAKQLPPWIVRDAMADANASEVWVDAAPFPVDPEQP